MKAREILIYLAIVHHGEWQDIYDAITAKEEISKDAEEIVKGANSDAITILDDEYPDWLKGCTRPPFVLFYHGDISLLNDYSKMLAVVGTRKPSIYGDTVTRDLVSRVAKDLVIISGMARGIDTIAHETAIANGGKTVAVLGGGINNCYPLSNKDLYKKLCKNHLVLSEYPDKTEPVPDNFPKRNRIIAALCKVLLVTEAHPNSGTQITVAHALYNNRDVACVPYGIYENSVCNRLIYEGATLVQNGNDILYLIQDAPKVKNS